MEIQLNIIGSLLIVLAALHIGFPRYFNWKQDCGSMSLVNRQMFYVHSFFIGLTIFLMGLLCLTSAAELLNSNFGKRICLGLGIFWMARLCVQIFGYSSKLWRGKKFETVMHIVFTIFWTYLSAVFIVLSCQ